MAKIPEIFVDLKANTAEFEKDMRKAKQIASESAKGISTALNGALSSTQVSKGTNSLINSLGNLNKASKVSSQTFKQLGVDLGSLQRVTGVTGAQFQALQSKMLATAGAKAQEKALRDIARQADLTEKEIRELGSQFGLSKKQIDQVTGTTGKATQSFSVLGGAVRAALAYFSIDAVVGFARSVVQTGVQVDSLNRSFVAITGSAQAAQKEFDFLRETANRTGQNFYALTDSYRQLTASTQGTKIAGEETRRVFSSMSEAAAVLGMSNQQLELSFKAFAQMAGKGVVQMEELKGQLGDSLPGAVNIAAQAMGVSVKRLMEMSAAGELLAEDLLPKMADQLHKMYGEAANTAALESGIAAINRFNQAWTDLKASLYDNKAFVAAADALSTAFNFYADALKDDTSINGIKEQIEEQGAALEHNKALLDEYQSGWVKGSPQTISELTTKIKDQGTALEGLKLRLLEAQNAADPAVKAAVEAGSKMTDSWVKAGEQKAEAITRAQKMESEALAAQAKEEEQAARKSIEANKQRAEQQAAIMVEMTDMIKTSAMTQTEIELHELEKRKAAHMEAAKGNIQLQRTVTEAYAAEQNRLTMLIEAGVDKRTAAERESLEQMKDGWLTFNEGKAEAAKRAGEEIQQAEKETTTVFIDEWSNALESVQSSLADMIYEFDFSMDSILDIFKRMLAEMLAAIAMSGIKDALLGLFDIGGGGGGILGGLASLLGGSKEGGGGGGGGVLSALSSTLSAGKIISTVKGWLGISGAASGSGVAAGTGVAGTSGFFAGTGSGVGGSAATTAAGGTAATSGGGMGFSAAGLGAVATYATVAAAVVMVAKGIIDKSSRPNAANEIDYAGVTPANLQSMNDQWVKLNNTVLASIPGFQQYESAIYSANNSLLVATGATGTIALKYDESAAAGNRWSAFLTAASGALMDATSKADSFRAGIEGSGAELGKTSSLAEASRSNLEGLNSILSDTATAVSTLSSASQDAASGILGAAGDMRSIMRSLQQTAVYPAGGGVSYHADGGIFTRPTRWGSHIIGESGAEALVPLPSPDILSQIASKLDKISTGGGAAPVVHVYIGNEKLDARIQVVSDRLDADRDPLARGRRYVG